MEQNVHLALALSDYAYVIAEGRSFCEGPCEQVAAMPEIRKAYLGLQRRARSSESSDTGSG